MYYLNWVKFLMSSKKKFLRLIILNVYGNFLNWQPA